MKLEEEYLTNGLKGYAKNTIEYLCDKFLSNID